MKKTILTVNETVQRSHEEGMPISDYSLRRAIRSGAIPCRIVVRKYLIAWSNVVRWMLCADGQDNNGTEERCKDYGTIRPIEAE